MADTAIIGVVQPETITIDELDRKIIRCVQLSPRAPFRTVAEVLDVSEQTVARRYRRLERGGLLRVTALLRPAAIGQHNWMVRVQVRPSGAESLARALAQRDDVSWVTLVSGGAEVLCVLRARTSAARDDLLMQRLPRTSPVLGMSAAMVLHRFVGGGGEVARDWTALVAELDEAQQRTVVATATPVPSDDLRFELLPEDHAIFDTLAADGRASFTSLARAAGISESRAARRVEALITGGALYLDVDLPVAALGLGTTASLWLTVTPRDLDAAGRALADQKEIAFAGAITGSSNLTASVVCRDTEHLYRFVSERLGAIAGVQTMEVLPVLRHVKQAGAFVDGDRLAVG